MDGLEREKEEMRDIGALHWLTDSSTGRAIRDPEHKPNKGLPR